jgi:hypothetical protein
MCLRWVQRTLWIVIFGLSASSVTAAQQMGGGIELGVQMLDPFTMRGEPPYRAIAGVSFELEWNRGIAIAVDGRWRRTRDRYRSTHLSPGRFTTTTTVVDISAYSVEVPIVMRKYIDIARNIRTFGELGGAIRDTSGHQDFFVTETSPPNFPCVCLPRSFTEPFNPPWALGATAGAGVEWRVHRLFLIQPSFRYSRWRESAIEGSPLGMNRNSFDFFVGFKLKPQRAP